MGLFDGHCDIPVGSQNYDDRGTAYDMMRWIAVGCTAATGIILLVLKMCHLHSYTRPKEQRQIVRILIAPSVWALVSLGQILDYRTAQYIQPLGEVYESIYLCCVFLLFIQYAAPDSDFDGDMFQTVHDAHEGEAMFVDFDWPRLTWLFVFQFPVVNAISTIITEATEVAGTYCNGNFDPKFGYLWATVIQSITLGAAVTAILRFYKHMSKRLRARRGLAKLIGFKALVGLNWIQQIIFGILIDQKVIKPSKTFSYVDLLYGLPNVIVCGEMVFFALWFWWVCSPHEYSVAKQGTTPYPLWKAIPDSLNPMDWIMGIGRMFTICLHMHRTGGFKDWKKAKAAAKARKKAGKGSKWHLLGGGKDEAPRNGAGGPLYEEDSGYYRGYPERSDVVPLVEHPQKLYDPARGEM